MRYLTIRIQYPKPENTKDILTAVEKVAETARQYQIIPRIGAWIDKEKNRIVSITLWESEEHAVRARAAMHMAFKNIPWSKWERQPSENFLNLTRVI